MERGLMFGAMPSHAHAPAVTGPLYPTRRRQNETKDAHHAWLYMPVEDWNRWTIVPPLLPTSRTPMYCRATARASSPCDLTGGGGRMSLRVASSKVPLTCFGPK